MYVQLIIALNEIEKVTELIINFIIFCILGNINLKQKKTFLFITPFTVVILFWGQLLPAHSSSNILLILCEDIVLTTYFGYFKRYSYSLFAGALFFFLCGLLDNLLITCIVTLFNFVLFPEILVYFLCTILEAVFVYKFSNTYKNIISGSNNNIFVGLLLYLDIIVSVISWYILDNRHTTQVLLLSFGLLLFQAVFLFTIYLEILQRQKQILDKKQQDQLIKENKQLKEYSEYLESNEDELRRFKHDYQNILNSLRYSAKKDKAQKIVEQLDKYTNTQIDQKALNKYRGVNQIYVEEIKSIIIVKLAKLYNLKINYSFDCQKSIRQIPKEVDVLDLSRIIGIVFDNAAEESQLLIRETGKKVSAHVEAMIYQENGNFEFEIKNKIRPQNVNLENLDKKNFSTKKNHMGLGLTNVKKIAHKYEQNLMINYDFVDDWFVFDLTILPN